MIKIEPYVFTPDHLAQLVDLINYCQNIEAGLGMKMADQADIFDIENHYQRAGGQFWLALDQGQVVGSIGLMPVNSQAGILKKFFTLPAYRGVPQHLGRPLMATLLTFAQTHDFSEIALDTPGSQVRAHHFYEKQGFQQIAEDQLKFHWDFPKRDSLIYLKEI